MKGQKIDIRPYTKQFYKGNGINVALLIIVALGEVIISLVCSWLLLALTDLISGSDIGFTLFQLLMIGVGTILFAAVGSMLACYARPRYFTRGISQYKARVFEEITKKNIAAFSGENSSTYVSALTNDIKTIEQGFLGNTFTIITNVLTFVGALTMMIYYSPLLTLIAIALALLPLIAALLTGQSMANKEKQVSSANESYTATMRDMLGGFSVIKSFKAEAQVLRIFKERIQALSTAERGKHKMRTIVEFFSLIATLIAQIGVFVVGAYLALSGKGITAGTTILFVQLMNYVLSPIGTLPTCFAERAAAKALVEKVASTLNENVREETQGEHRPLHSGITVENLCFGYEQDKQVLHNVNCRFDLGKKYAIVGASGSGKTTLLNLLLASYTHYQGNIYFDETELKEIPTASLYETESIIQQNVFIFNATIRDNITMFRSFPEEEIERAIQLSGLSAVIQAKGEGYLCGENGNGLSGGEKQRVAIARSLLKKSQVLLVDEATAALDSETARQVFDAILGLDGVTSIVVTHSLDEASLKRYDEILTMKNGQIVERGSFAELMDEKGYFYSLFTVAQ